MFIRRVFGRAISAAAGSAESTAAAYKVARDLGADYLELDLQRSKDGVLFALHDNNLQRTTDVATKFPERKDAPASEFTWKELQTLDAGSWFNAAYPDRARPGFVGLKILSLDDIIKIAEGNPQEQVLLQQVRNLSEAGVAAMARHGIDHIQGIFRPHGGCLQIY